MAPAGGIIVEKYRGDVRDLFHQRTQICLWLAVVFFSLFSILDFICCREHFRIFLMYRLVYVVTVICFINILAVPACKRYAPHLICAAMLLGGLVIALMTLRLGGFHSGYYVGILLMIAGALSVLPLTFVQAVLIGLGMYTVYLGTVLAGTGDYSAAHLVSMANNSFFFLSLVAVTAAQSYDDLSTLLRSLSVSENLRKVRAKLAEYRGDLEGLVQQRLGELEESDLKYRDLYNSLLDLVVLIDSGGNVSQINNHCMVMLGVEPSRVIGTRLNSFLRDEAGGQAFINDLIAELRQGKTVAGYQAEVKNRFGYPVAVELSGSRVTIEEGFFYQLVIRDISATKEMERKLFNSQRLIDTSRQAAIFGLARLAECRDDDTGAHLNRIRSYTDLLVRELSTVTRFSGQISAKFTEDLLRSSVLHDIGKVGIPDAVLLKPGRLTAEEFEVMKAHCIYGSDILADAEEVGDGGTFLYVAREIARHHHERWDGSGYPDGLSGDNIPLAARIVALADVYDALTSTRVYKAAYSHGEARELIVKGKGDQFDPDIVDAFLRQESEFKECRMKFLLQETRS